MGATLATIYSHDGTILRQFAHRVPVIVTVRTTTSFLESPYAIRISKAKKLLTIRLDEDTIKYVKSLAEQNGIPYQNLINLYLRECAESEKKLDEVGLALANPLPRTRDLGYFGKTGNPAG